MVTEGVVGVASEVRVVVDTGKGKDPISVNNE